MAIKMMTVIMTIMTMQKSFVRFLSSETEKESPRESSHTFVREHSNLPGWCVLYPCQVERERNQGGESISYLNCGPHLKFMQVRMGQARGPLQALHTDWETEILLPRTVACRRNCRPARNQKIGGQWNMSPACWANFAGLPTFAVIFTPINLKSAQYLPPQI